MTPGYIGEPQLGTAENGEKLLAAMADWAVEAVEKLLV